MALRFRFLSICPRIRRERDTLEAETAAVLQLVTLGGVYRRVVVDPRSQLVRIRRRLGWIFNTEWLIPFGTIKRITYGYEDMAFAPFFAWSYDSADLFSVGLWLNDDERIHLFHFYGDGAFTNAGPLPDWFYWQEYLFDATGTQETESRAFVDTLSRLIGVPVGPPK